MDLVLSTAQGLTCWHIHSIGTEVDSSLLEEFLERLDHFRPDAEIFLKMLNDMRRRLKELPQNSPAAHQYRLGSDK